MKKLIIDDITIRRNKSTTKYITTSPQQINDKICHNYSIIKTRKNKDKPEIITLLKKKTHVQERNDEISDFLLKIAKKSLIICNEQLHEKRIEGRATRISK